MDEVQGKTKRQAPRTSIFDTLDRLKTYKEFESVTVTPDGTISVKYAGKSVAAPEAEKKKPEKKIETAIDSLNKPAPIFAFGK